MSLPGRSSLWIYPWKFRFPEPDNRRRHSRYFTDLSYLEIEFVGNFYFRMRIVLHLKPLFKNNRNPDKRDFFQYSLEG